MKALVYGGPGEKSWTDVPDPVILQATDAIVRIDTTTICGTDLHILKGDVPAVQPGRILGHEGVGTVTDVGSSISSLRTGDRVIISCIKSCGHCGNCRKGLFSHCLGDEGQAGTGWIFGHLIDGTQAEFVRVPYAENSLHKLPRGVTDDEAVMLSDILPTAFEIGVQAGHVAPGDVVAVVGAGPIGLAAMATAGLHGAATVVAIDPDEGRLAKARDFGATHTVNPAKPGWIAEVLTLTDGAGVDVSMEAVGIPETFDMALRLVRPGGYVANIGVHGKPVELPLQDLWIQNINISMGLVNTNTTPMLLRLVAQHKLPADKFATHHFGLEQIIDAYDTFSRAAETGALKVVLSRTPHD
ncbi:zinc-dependent alcohol dehydrogenase family protein [Arthrobacter sp. D5-1]|uniref:zinc-dependent alcohol dehydrogenase family protein n=1 Tax=Arthrobacter sp. D5-1 TaxID=1477518 RepID=UPI001A9A0407|nr:zinc-dependent alcohol dehydrogenase family protein [Arthrobacter sp. D5-1]QSZ48694.1 alcohol dehydrogenase [Arthrobacter sp. D5-1]